VVDSRRFGGKKEDGALFLDEVDVIEGEVYEDNKLEHYTKKGSNYSEFEVEYETPSDDITVRGQIKAQAWDENYENLGVVSYYVTKAYIVNKSGEITVVN
jgi:hypothetical protein